MNRSEGRAGRLFLVLIGLMLILIGGVFSWLMIRSYQHAKASREWVQTEAYILRSVVDERVIAGSPREFRLNVLYGYTYQGKDYSSDKISPRGAKWLKEASLVVELAAQYPASSTHTAWVNPDDPNVAILEHDTKAAGYTVWFPCVIMLGGVGMIWGAMKRPTP